MDKVFIEGLEIEALIGIYDWERRIRQPLRFDLEMAFDNRRPAASDAIEDTLDYKAVSKRLIAFVSQSGFGLVETLAERCAALVLEEFGVAHVRLKLSKPGAVRGASAVGVIIERSRQAPGVAGDIGAQAGQESEPQPARPDVSADSTAMPTGAAANDTRGEGSAADATPSTAPAAGEAADEAIVQGAASAPPAMARTNALAAAITPDLTPTPADAAPPSAPAPTAFPAPPRPRNPASALGRATRPAYLSLGSNIDPATNLRSALRALRARFGEVIVSPVYRIPAVGFEGPDFLNAAAIIDSDLDPFALVAWLQNLESAHGRLRGHVKHSSRTLDMDIVYFDSLVLDLPGRLQLPRPELRHAFVLKPLADIAPGFVDPVRHKPLAELWAVHPERERAFETVVL